MTSKKTKNNKNLIIALVTVTIIAVVSILAIVFLARGSENYNKNFSIGDKINIQVNDNETYVFTVIEGSDKNDDMVTAILDGYYEKNGEKWFLDYESDDVINLLGWDKPKKVRMLSLDEAEELGCGEWDDRCEWLSEDLTYPGSQKTGFYQYAFWIDARNSIGRRYIIDEQGFLDTEGQDEHRGIRPVVYISKQYTSLL